MVQPHRPVTHPARVRLLSALVGAVAVGLVAALVLVVAPAQAQVAIPVDCSNDKVVLEWDDMAYDLDGNCGVVVVAADNTRVSMPTATRLVVRGQDNVVRAKPVTDLVVRGHDNQVSTPSLNLLRLASPGSTIDVAGLVEEAALARRGGTVRARQVTDLVVRGARHDVRARRGYDTRIPGDRNTVRFGRLDTLRMAGDRNRVRVRRGQTEVRVSGSANHVRVNRRG